jgi:hypothetical protein
MQYVQAGKHKLVQLEFDIEFLTSLVTQAGFEFRVEERKRSLVLDLTATNRDSPLLLFDAADPGNLGWFSRCQFYVDGKTGAVLQTPFFVANQRERSGRIIPTGIKIQLAKELPYDFRLPGRQPISEQVIYAVLFNFLNALQNVGVGLCGGPLVKPIAGRGEGAGVRG